MEDLPEKLYSKREVENARTKGQVLGWIQGGGVALGGILLLNMIGSWLPTLLVVGGIAYVGYRFFLKPRGKTQNASDEPIDV